MFKNHDNEDVLAHHQSLIEAQAALASICLKNNLQLDSTIGINVNASPFLLYKIKAGPEALTVFEGISYHSVDTQMDMIMELITGEMVSEVSPPAVSLYDGGKKVCYWRREMVSRQDATRLGKTRVENPEVKSEVQWVGYSDSHREVQRITDGRANPGWDNVKRIEFVELGPLGTVVAVVPRTLDGVNKNFPPSLGELITQKEIADEAERQRLKDVTMLALSTANVSALNTDQIAALSTDAVTALAPPPAVVSEELKELLDAGIDPTTAERVYVVMDRTYAADIPLHRSSTVTNFRGSGVDVTFLIPHVLTRTQYDAMNDVQRPVYLETIDGYRQLVQDETVKAQVPELHELFCKFLRDVLESNMFQKAWGAELLELATRQQIEEFPTRSVYGAGILQFSDEVMIELFGTDDSNPKAKIGSMQSCTSTLTVSMMMGAEEEFVQELLKKMGYIGILAALLDYEVAAILIRKLGWNTERLTPMDGEPVLAVE